ncbi:hypothetical protein [Mycobacterium sp. AZCC_0083]|uniref:hypothetical protein n=1 Tax=Mycobacterium sp. AZCC_0083 TaxID=2735882 RepID=UPI00161F6E44|nr:hypothetical protein [Mycobacterium sp. AZCC_0083]MBB5161916.1 hypothetical protein [Mycobacterium sp. AZCC_0083]
MMPGTVFRGVDEFRGVFDGMWYAFPDLRLEVLRGPFFADGGNPPTRVGLAGPRRLWELRSRNRRNFAQNPHSRR